jgi:hypothetical protein
MMRGAFSMNSISQSNQVFPKNYEVVYTIQGELCSYLIEIKEIFFSSVCGTFFDELCFRLCRMGKRNKVLFRIGASKFGKQLNLQQVVKYGAVAYVIAAILVIPTGICSRPYRPFNYVLPILASASVIPDPDVESESMDRFNCEQAADQDTDDTQVEDSESDLPFHNHIMQAAQTYQVDAALIQAIIMAESNNNPKAVSHRGAQGLMQLMPTTAKWLGVVDSFDPALNIDGGVRYFKRLLDRFDGNIRLALAAYNAGSRYVYKYGGVPPFRATRIYIKKVLNYHRLFQGQTASTENGLTTS